MTKDGKLISEGERRDKYFKTVFGTAYPEKERIEAALNRAHEIRQFEIRLYWQRSLFFWGFILALFGGLGLLLTAEDPGENQLKINYIIFGIASLGFFISFAWFHIERGSKFWQENWELHIDFLEDAITGRLYKTLLGKSEDCFSVSKITQSIILAFFLFWFAINFVAVMNIVPSFGNDIKCFVVSILDEASFWVGLVLSLLLPAILTVFLIICSCWRICGYWRTSEKTRPVNGQKQSKVFMSTRDFPDITGLNK